MQEHTEMQFLPPLYLQENFAPSYMLLLDVPGS